MRLLLLAITLLVSPSSLAQRPPVVSTPPADDMMMADTTMTIGTPLIEEPWHLTPPSFFPACADHDEPLRVAREAHTRAMNAQAAGAPLPDLPTAVNRTASLYSDLELRNPLQVRADAGSLSARRVVRRASGGLSIEGEMLLPAGSRFRVYVSPTDTDVPDLSRLFADRETVLAAAVALAASHVTTAEQESVACVSEQAFRWRQRQADEAGYVLTRTLRRIPSTGDAPAIESGREVWVSLMDDDETEFMIAFPTRRWVPTSDLADAEFVRSALRPKMERLDALMDELDREFYARMPDILFTDLRAVGEYSLSGFNFEFQNLSGKTVRYIHITVQPYNRVGDPITRRQGGGAETVTLVGPSETSRWRTYSGEFDSLWLSSLVDCVRITRVRVQWMEGGERTWSSNIGSLFEVPSLNSCH